MNLIFLGPPGAGKGTQAALVSRAFHIPHVSTGEMFRKAIGEHTIMGRSAQRYIDAGKLVPDAVVIEMVRERIAEPDCASGYLLDGFPRTRPQAEALHSFAETDRVINILLDDAVLIKRLSGRRVCPACKATHHLDALRNENCPHCGAGLIRRVDDSESAVATRLEVYYRQTLPLVDYYTREGILTDVDGNGSIEEVCQRITRAIER